MVSGRTLMSFRGGSGVGAGPPDSPQAQAPVLSAESVLTQGTLEMLRPIGKDRALGGRGGGLWSLYWSVVDAWDGKGTLPRASRI